MKLYFACLFGVDFDFDIAERWISHYKKFDIDSFTIFLHSEKDDKEKINYCKSIFEKYGCKTYLADRYKFYEGGLRRHYLARFNNGLSKSDMLVTADSDEFQQIPDSYRESLQGRQVLTGELIDRYSQSLQPYDSNRPLEVQYPLSGNVEQQVFNIADKRYFKAFAWTSKRKIICAPGQCPVAFGGSHRIYLKYIDDYSVSDKKIRIHHYRWRKNVIERMCQRRYNKAIYLWYYMQFFNVPDPKNNPHFLKRLEWEENIQKKRGWTV